MTRNIIVSTNKKDNIDELCQYVDIHHVDNIVNDSVDNLFCDSLEALEENTISQVIQILMSKIRPEGYLAIKILDTKKICLEYLENKISNQNLLQLLSNRQCILNLDAISASINTETFITIKIHSDNYHIVMILQRRGL